MPSPFLKNKIMDTYLTYLKNVLTFNNKNGRKNTYIHTLSYTEKSNMRIIH